MPFDLGIRDGLVAALGAGLPPGGEEIDARGFWSFPAGWTAMSISTSRPVTGR